MRSFTFFGWLAISWVASAAAAPTVFCLDVERHPLALDWGETEKSTLLREIARQGVLIAAREELGLATRDATLSEPFIEDPAARFAFEFRAWSKQPFRARLLAGDTAGREVWADDFVAEQQQKWRRAPARLIVEITEQTRAIADALRRAGFEGKRRRLTQNEPSEEVMRLLGRMDFVSQYAAVRAAHQAHARGEASAAWLDLLSRGYAHLALLSGHFWSTHSQVFTARSLLYAERLCRATRYTPMAMATRVYVRAVVGWHSAALDSLEALEKKIEENPAPGESWQPPAWLAVVRPYCRFDYEGLAQVRKQNRELSPLVARLTWELYRTSWHGRWLYEQGRSAIGRVPEAYGVYSTMANCGTTVAREIGVEAGPKAFGRRLPRRVSRLEGLPQRARDAIPAPGGFFGLGAPRDEFSPVPSKVATALLEVTTQAKTPAEPSWAMLGELITEQQFVLLVDHLTAWTSGVEVSFPGSIDTLIEQVAGHTYYDYLKTFALDWRPNPNSYYDAFENMKVEDPRGNMAPMLKQIRRYSRTEQGRKRGTRLKSHAIWSHGYTFPGLVESVDRAVAIYRGFKSSRTLSLGRELQAVSRHSPVAFRLEVQYRPAEDTDDALLAQWEVEAPADPITWLTLGNRYYRLSRYEDAARCYQRSLDISPSFVATSSLAESYLNGGKPELWLPALEAYLEFEDLGKSHSEVHRRAARGLLQRGEYAAAERHALALAEDESSEGLLLASEVYEGLQDWQRSEDWVSQASEAYSSSVTSLEWYLWCNRTGRGDFNAASEAADEWIKRGNKRRDKDTRFGYHLLEGRPATAYRIIVDVEQATDVDDAVYVKLWRLAHVVLLAQEQEETEQLAEAVQRFRQIVSDHLTETDPKVALLSTAFCDLIESKPSVPTVDMLERELVAVRASFRCNYAYFLGCALEAQGRSAEADQLWRRAAFDGPYDRLNATLAGARLVARHGRGRGGPPRPLSDLAAAGQEVASPAR